MIAPLDKLEHHQYNELFNFSIESSNDGSVTYGQIDQTDSSRRLKEQ